MPKLKLTNTKQTEDCAASSQHVKHPAKMAVDKTFDIASYFATYCN